MATGPSHYAEAERLLATDHLGHPHPVLVAIAQVHATLALAAATADPFDHQPEWAEVTR